MNFPMTKDTVTIQCWCSYDQPETGEIAGIVCPEHAHLLGNDPTLAPLEGYPDPTRKCAICDKAWEAR